MKRINLFGGPCTGKSTLAANLFGELKQMGHHCELVTEFVKTWTYQEKVPTQFDQVFITANQIQNESILLRSGKLELIVTDSPIYLGVMYCRMYGDPVLADALEMVVGQFDEKYESINVLLPYQFPHVKQGRFGNEFSNKQDHKFIINSVKKKYDCIEFDQTTCNAKHLAQQIENML